MKRIKKSIMDYSENGDGKEVAVPPSKPISGLWVAGVVSAVVLLAGLLLMGFTLVLKQQELTGFQTFVTSVLGVISAGVTGFFVKYTYDKNKTVTQQQEFQKWQITKTMEQQEKLEILRLQTNGRLHTRDELSAIKDELIDVLLEVSMNPESLTPEVKGVIKSLRVKIKEGENLVKNLKPFYDKNGN